MLSPSSGLNLFLPASLHYAKTQNIIIIETAGMNEEASGTRCCMLICLSSPVAVGVTFLSERVSLELHKPDLSVRYTVTR